MRVKYRLFFFRNGQLRSIVFRITYEIAFAVNRRKISIILKHFGWMVFYMNINFKIQRINFHLSSTQNPLLSIEKKKKSCLFAQKHLC